MYIPVSNLAKFTQSSFDLSQKAKKWSRSPSLKEPEFDPQPVWLHNPL